MSEFVGNSDHSGRRSDERQTSRFGLPRQAQGSFEFRAACDKGPSIRIRVKKAVAADIEKCPLSRVQITERLSLLLGSSITVSQLDAITAEGHAHRFPAEWIPAWVRVTGSVRILEMLCEDAGMWLAGQREHDLAELALAELRRRKLADRATNLRKRLSGEI